MARILVADDEPAIAMAIRDELLFEGFDVQLASDGHGALALARTWQPAVLVLDLMLPGRNGFDVCRTLRPEQPALWIILLTVRGQEVDRVSGFEAGADDYVTKPFSLRELVGRIRVGLRRSDAHRQPHIVRFGAISVDVAARRVTNAGRVVELTPKEFDILAFMLRRPGVVVSRDEFLDHVWGQDIHVTQRTVDTHMASLRRKIEPRPEEPTYIAGVRGVGYRLDAIFTES